MLKLFRKKHVAKIIFWALVILIIPAFVLWGTGSIRSGEKGPAFVGIINNKKVSFEELFEGLAAIRTLLTLNYFNKPEVLNAFLGNKPLLAKLAWDRLIMLKEARRLGIKVPDKDVIGYIREHPLFLRNDKFDSKLYDYVLRYNMGLAPRTFEEIVRLNLQVHRLNDLLTKDITITDEEVLNGYKRRNEKFKISYVIVASKDFLDKIVINDDELRYYYEKHKHEFILPVKEGEAKDSSPEALAADFGDVKASIKSFLAEERARAIAFKEAEGIYKKISDLMEKEKKLFGDAAAKLGLKLQETNYFSRSDYLEGIGEAERLADAALNLKRGELSRPMETRKGGLIFTVLDVQRYGTEKFEKERGEFSKKALNDKKDRFLEDWLKTLELRARLNIDLKDIDKYYR